MITFCLVATRIRVICRIISSQPLFYFKFPAKHLLNHTMSLPFPALHSAQLPKVDNGLRLGEHGVHETFKFGFNQVSSKVEIAHPIESSEKNFRDYELNMHMNMLRNTQGLHAPLKIAAEVKATRAVGRLPFLESSGLSEATVLCRDDQLDFTDVLNLPEQDERLFIPHVVMEHSLGIL